MKKFLVALLSTAMVVGCCNVAWADDGTLSGNDIKTITPDNQNGTLGNGETTDTATSTKDVIVNITKNAIYSIDVTWQSMEMEYNYGKWTRTGYSDEGQGWTCSNNKVTVTNYSNADIKWGATFAYKTGFENVTGTFNSSSDGTGTNLSNTTVTLSSAEGAVQDGKISVNATSLEGYLKLEGTPAANASSAAGTATVTIGTP